MDRLTPGGLSPAMWTPLSSMDLHGCPGLPVFALGLFLHFLPFPFLMLPTPPMVVIWAMQEHSGSLLWETDKTALPSHLK